MNKNKKIVQYQLVDDLDKVNIGVHILDNSSFSSELHTHTFFDFDFLQSGSLLQTGNGKTIRMAKNEVCIVRPECEHQTTIDGNKKFFLYNFVVDYEYLKDIFNYYYNEDIDNIITEPITKIQLSTGEIQEINQLLQLLQANISNNNKYEFYLKIIIFTFIKNLILKNNFSSTCKNDIPTVVQEVLIELNKPENFSLTIMDICKKISYSHEHIIRLFNKHGLESPNKLFLKNKLRYATMLLKSSKMRIAEIAERCGIFTMSYFNKSFRAEYNISPTEYKKKYKTPSLF